MKYKEGDKVLIEGREVLEAMFQRLFYKGGDLIDLEREIQATSRVATISEVLEEINKYIITLDNGTYWGIYPRAIAGPAPKRGELVLVTGVSGGWSVEPRIFAGYIEGSVTPYCCVAIHSEKNFREGRAFDISCWKQVKPFTPSEKKSVTLELTDEQLEKIKEIINE